MGGAAQHLSHKMASQRCDGQLCTSWSKRTVGQGARRVCTNSFLVLIFDFEVLEAGTSGSGDDASSSDIVLVWVPATCYWQ